MEHANWKAFNVFRLNRNNLRSSIRLGRIREFSATFKRRRITSSCTTILPDPTGLKQVPESFPTAWWYCIYCFHNTTELFHFFLGPSATRANYLILRIFPAVSEFFPSVIFSLALSMLNLRLRPVPQKRSPQSYHFPAPEIKVFVNWAFAE